MVDKNIQGLDYNFNAHIFIFKFLSLSLSISIIIFICISEKIPGSNGESYKAKWKMENFKRANSDFFHCHCLRFSYNRKKYELSFCRFKLISKPLNAIFSLLFLCAFPATRKLKKKKKRKEKRKNTEAKHVMRGESVRKRGRQRNYGENKIY